MPCWTAIAPHALVLCHHKAAHMSQDDTELNRRNFKKFCTIKITIKCQEFQEAKNVSPVTTWGKGALINSAVRDLHTAAGQNEIRLASECCRYESLRWMHLLNTVHHWLDQSMASQADVCCNGHRLVDGCGLSRDRFLDICKLTFKQLNVTLSNITINKILRQL